MAAMTRKDSMERQAAVLRYFIDGYTKGEDPTGEEAQRLLTNGRLTGQKGPPMGNGMLYKLQRQAKDMVRKGGDLKLPPVPVARGDSTVLDAEQLAPLRAKSHEVQKLLNELPGTIVELHITRDGVRVVRLQATEENL